MNNDLIERYIYAVTKRLPGKTREDVARELRTLLIDVRCPFTKKKCCGKIVHTESETREKYDEI